METSGLKADGAAERVLTEVLRAASERGLIVDAAIAGSLAQARDFWRLRESYSPAQKPEGGNIKNDISVAVARIPEFIARADAAGCAPLPRRAAACRSAHFGDGSVHYNIAQPHGHGEGRRSWRTGTTSRTPCRTSSSSSAARSRPSTASA